MYNYDVDYLRRVAKELGLNGDFGFTGLKFTEDNKTQLDYYKAVYKNELKFIKNRHFAIFNGDFLNHIFGYLLNKPVISEEDLLETYFIKIASCDEQVFEIFRNFPEYSLKQVIQSLYGDCWQNEIIEKIGNELLQSAAEENFIPSFNFKTQRRNEFKENLQKMEFLTVFIEDNEDNDQYLEMAEITIEKGDHIWQTFENTIKGLVLMA